MTNLSRDVWAGLALVAIGSAAIVLIWDLPTGRLVRMGPAYLPIALGLLLILLGGVIAVRGWIAASPPLGSLPWKPLLLVPAALIVFGVVMRSYGLIPASLLLIGIAVLAGDERRWSEAAVSAVVLTGLCAAVFRLGLNLPLPLWLAP